MEIDKKIIKKLIEALEGLKKSLNDTGIICGLGANGYILAINAMQELLKDGN